MPKSIGRSTTNSYYHLPSLAGLCSLEHAAKSDWSVEESVVQLKRIHYVLKRLCQAFVYRIPGEPVYELKMVYSHHAYLCSENVGSIRKRVSEMREPPLGLDKLPHEGLQRLMDEIECAPDGAQFLFSVYEVLLPSVYDAVRQLQERAHPLADAPTVRLAKLLGFELKEMLEYGKQAREFSENHLTLDDRNPIRIRLEQCIYSAGGISGDRFPKKESAIEAQAVPEPYFSKQEFRISYEPQRDARFHDKYNAGVNPEAFLYNESYPARAKTLMMYYKRLREIDVPEMMATILYDLRDEEPWEFHQEMIRQLWDEARHAMMGEVGFFAQGIDWTEIPINFTWSNNLNTQLNARERHGVLFFIEQGLMPRTGKRYEWEVGQVSGDCLSALFQDFDWADEVLHSQIGRRWYVPKFSSLQEALRYGDQCWSQVLSHWEAYREKGLTEHRNWWPDLYRKACEKWRIEPEKEVLAFQVSYQDIRADLKNIE